MTYKLSEAPIDGQYRLASDEHCVFGIACYVGDVVDGMFQGRIALNIADPKQAEGWLRGEEPTGCVVRPKANEAWI